MTRAQLEEKFRQCAEGAIPAAQAGRVIEAVWALDEQDSLGTLAAALADASSEDRG